MSNEINYDFYRSACFYGLEDFLGRKLEDVEFDIRYYEFMLKNSINNFVEPFDIEEISYMQTMIHDIFERMDEIKKELKDIANNLEITLKEIEKLKNK